MPKASIENFNPANRRGCFICRSAYEEENSIMQLQAAIQISS